VLNPEKTDEVRLLLYENVILAPVDLLMRGKMAKNGVGQGPTRDYQKCVTHFTISHLYYRTIYN
jgi:hypothetical protein